MNARGSGVVPRESGVFDKARGRISKATGRKIQIVGKEIQSQGKRIPSVFLPRIGAFQGLAGESKLRDCEPLFSPTRPSAAGAGARGRATTRRRNASPQGWSRACFARAVPQSMPASLPAALAAFFLETKSNDSTDLENRKQKSCRTMRLSTITHG